MSTKLTSVLMEGVVGRQLDAQMNFVNFLNFH
jgi:hypothetical protein